jgi:hypothetical protein
LIPRRPSENFPHRTKYAQSNASHAMHRLLEPVSMGE